MWIILNYANYLLSSRGVSFSAKQSWSFLDFLSNDCARKKKKRRISSRAFQRVSDSNNRLCYNCERVPTCFDAEAPNHPSFIYPLLVVPNIAARNRMHPRCGQSGGHRLLSNVINSISRTGERGGSMVFFPEDESIEGEPSSPDCRRRELCFSLAQHEI